MNNNKPCPHGFKEEQCNKCAQEKVKMSKLYFLQDSRQVVGNDILLWGKNRRGYTTNLDEAHLFTLDEALSERDTDIPWEETLLRSLCRPVVDCQNLPRSSKAQLKFLIGEIKL